MHVDHSLALTLTLTHSHELREMSILDDDSFESYFAVSTATSPPCTAMKGRYDSCFFKSYSESMLTPLPPGGKEENY